MPEWVEVECVTGKWIVSLNEEELRVISPSGEMLHRSHGHLAAGKHIAMLLSQLEQARSQGPTGYTGFDSGKIFNLLKEIEMLKDSLQDRMRAYSELAERTGNV